MPYIISRNIISVRTNESSGEESVGLLDGLQVICKYIREQSKIPNEIFSALNLI